MKKEVINKEDFINKLNIWSQELIGVPVEDRVVYLKGGYGFLTVMQNILNERFKATSIFLDSKNIGVISQSPVGLQVGTTIKSAFLPGFGWIKLKHDSKFDAGFSREINQEIIKGLPECSYQGEVFIEKKRKDLKSLGVITTLTDIPDGSIKEVVERLKTSVIRFKEELNAIEKELN